MDGKFYLILGENEESTEVRAFVEDSAITAVVIEIPAIETPYLLAPDGDYRGASVIRQFVHAISGTPAP